MRRGALQRRSDAARCDAKQWRCVVVRCGALLSGAMQRHGKASTGLKQWIKSAAKAALFLRQYIPPAPGEESDGSTHRCFKQIDFDIRTGFGCDQLILRLCPQPVTSDAAEESLWETNT